VPDPDLSAELTAAAPSPGAASAGRPSQPSVEIGVTLDHFEILGLLGAGGFGEVYRARDVRLERVVALKLLPDAFTKDAERRERFRREALAASALNHPNICTVHDLVESGGRYLIVMELVDGQTLHAALAGGPLPPERAVEIALQIARALGEAHRAGILHRDIKGGNVILTPRGQVKVLDFGLAKRLSPAADAGSGPDGLTREGMALGTLTYMSPEQLLGKMVDQRTDLFSLGVLLYEMVTGRLPFRGSTTVAVADAILHAPPQPFEETRHVPEKLRAVILKLLEKDASRRYASAEELEADLRALSETAAPARRGRLAAIAAVLIVLLGGASAWLWHRTARARWARETALPQIAKLVAEEDYVKAFALAAEAKRVLPGDPQLQKLVTEATLETTLKSEPPGALVSYRRIGSGSGAQPGAAPWTELGRTPLTKARIPRAYYLFRFENPGFLPAFRIWPTWSLRLGIAKPIEIRLDREGSLPPGMVRVAGDKVELSIPGLDHLPQLPLADYLIDRTEVTNEEYKKFVDAGGYDKPDSWKQPFVKDGRTLPWRDAVALFRDSTGRPGPAGWEQGSFPRGQEKHPVAGVSWYEAAAYAEFAGKSLPTVYHWNWAAQTRASQLIVPGSNFAGTGTVPVGADGAVSGFGTTDMAGNVKEWCANESGEGRRFILGGGFGEPSYMFIDQDAQNPWDRRATYGFRCAKLLEKAPEAAWARIEVPFRDYAKEKPVSDDVFRAYAGLYAYDKTDLNVKVESTETSDEWTTEKVSFDAAYGGERVVAYVFVPKKGTPPFQAAVYFPGSGAIHTDAFALSSYADFVPRSGRVLIAPVYKGTYQRRDALKSDYPDTTALWRDHVIAWQKDLSRSVDYLVGRKDVDAGRLAYVGLSWGGAVAPVMLAVERRFRAAVLLSGGLEFQKSLPEVDEFNFVTRVKIPVLMINGRYDHFFPVESSQLPFFKNLGTPEPDKRYVVYETGHAPPRKEFIKESLDFLDKHLGPVKR
jgi:dienelactone hydrolase